MKHSPGCKCCKSCRQTDLLWAPSSPYDRGEYTDDDQWKPYTEYLQGDQFWAQSADRNGDLQKFLYTAPVTMFSGGGWTNAEESRYSRGPAISYADRLDDFYLFGDGWSSDQITLEEQLNSRRLRREQGIVSVREFEEDNWQIGWDGDVVRTEEYDTAEMPTFSARILAYGNAEYQHGIDDLPTSGVITALEKAEPNQRAVPPFPEECIPSCETLYNQTWNPDNPQCGDSRPPYRPEFVMRHGTLVDGSENLSDSWDNYSIPLSQYRSTQPENCTVAGVMDAETDSAGGPIDMHADGNGVKYFGDYYYKWQDFQSWEMQNRVTVVTSDGQVSFGGLPIDVVAGDIIKIDDFTKIGTGDESAFLLIPAAEITEQQRTHCQSNRKSVELSGSLSSLAGKRVAYYVEEFRDVDIPRTNDGGYYVQFPNRACRITTVATSDQPECDKYFAYECTCKDLRLQQNAVALQDISKYEYCYREPQSPSWDNTTGFETVEEDMNSLVSVGDSATFGDRCFGRAATGSIKSSWAIQGNSGVGGKIGPSSYSFRASVPLFVQYSEFKILDCIGKRDKAVLGRSVVFFVGMNTIGWQGPYLDIATARADKDYAISKMIESQANTIQSWICLGNTFNEFMTADGEGPLVSEPSIFTPNERFVQVGVVPYRVVAASNHVFSLEKDVAESCSYAATLGFPITRSEELEPAGRRYQFVDHCPSVAGNPESQNPEAVSFAGSQTTLFTT